MTGNPELLSLIATAAGACVVLMAAVALVVWLSRGRTGRLRARHRRDRTAVAGTAGGAP